LTFVCVCVTIYNMTFCYSPWTNIDIGPNGDIRPCCKFQMGYYNEKFNAQQDQLSEYTNSDFLSKIKKEFKQGHWPKGCERCQNEEQNNIKSKRQLDYQRWQEHYATYELDSNQCITASIAFGNTCNLKCITCNSIASSKWHQEYNEIYKKNFKPVKFYRKDFVEKFIQQAPDIVHLDFSGGETFLSGLNEQQQLLRHYIDIGQAQNISLHYTTNATIFPESIWWDLWKHFKEIDVQLSIDGVRDRYQYIRYPAEWSVIKNNIKQYINKQNSNFKLSVSHTVSAYNIYYLDEFFYWCYKIGLPQPWLGQVYDPVYMRPTVWSQPAKKKIVSHLRTIRHAVIQNWADIIESQDSSEHFEEFKQRLYQHDQYRGLDFKKVFPELAEYI
jgi:MoaA/NifB/PqqE/SkfB family radical SAM enzyme